MIKQYDTGTGFRMQLLDNDEPIDITNADVYFSIRNSPLDDILATHEHPKSGTVLVTFQEEHTAIPGALLYDIKVNYHDGRVETFPNNEYGVLVILASNQVGG